MNELICKNPEIRNLAATVKENHDNFDVSINHYDHCFVYINSNSMMIKINNIQHGYYLLKYNGSDDYAAWKHHYHEKMNGGKSGEESALDVMGNSKTSWNSICQIRPKFHNKESSNSNGDLKCLFTHLENDENYTESEESFNLISKSRFKKDIEGFVDSKDEDIIANLFYVFRKELPNVNVEYGAVHIFGANIGFSSLKTSKTNIPEYIKKEGVKNELLVLLHNHGYDLSNFPSDEDLESYAKYGIKYGITTTNLGTVIVKNKEQELNKQNAKYIAKEIVNIKLSMIEDFEKEFGKPFDEDNLQDNKDISRMVDENRNKYFEQYRNVLDNYDMSIIFINEQD